MATPLPTPDPVDDEWGAQLNQAITEMIAEAVAPKANTAEVLAKDQNLADVADPEQAALNLFAALPTLP
jgi:hypothetical protein